MTFIRPALSPFSAITATTVTPSPEAISSFNQLGWGSLVQPNGTIAIDALRSQVSSLLTDGPSLKGLELPSETVEILRQFSDKGEWNERIVVSLGHLLAAQQAAWDSVRSGGVSEVDVSGEVRETPLALTREQTTAFLKQMAQQSGLVDGHEWRSEVMAHELGRGVSIVSQNPGGALQAVALASFDAQDLVPRDAIGRGGKALEGVLRRFFTDRELDPDNLGAYLAPSNDRKSKLHSRIAGILSLKAATFRAAGLPLPGEAGGESLKWTDVEYARESFRNSEGEERYRRVRRLDGEVGRALAGRGVFANFADDGWTGAAIVAVESFPRSSGVVSLGLDITDARRFGAPEQAQYHADGEAAYKATYFGGHQPFFMNNVIQQVEAGETLAPGRRRFQFSGTTDEAMRRLGGREAIGAQLHLGNLIGSLIVVRGEPAGTVLSQADVAPAGQGEASRDSSKRGGNGRESHSPTNGKPQAPTRPAADFVAAPSEERPALARMIEDGEANLIYALPGQASEYASFLVEQYTASPTAREIIERLGRVLFRHGIDLRKIVAGEISADQLASSAFSQPLIGLTQIVINAQLREMGYDLSKATAVIGHSQGQILGIQAVSDMPDEEFIDFLAMNGKLMQEADPLFEPEVGDTLNLMKIATAKTSEQLEMMQRYTGKISMVTTLGIPRAELEVIAASVTKDLEGELAQVSLKNIEAGDVHRDRLPEGWEPTSGGQQTALIVSGTTEGLKELARRVSAVSDKYKVRVLPTTAAFHSELMRPALERVWPHLVGKSLGHVAAPVLLNHDGSRLQDITGTVVRRGPDGTEYTIDARIAAVTEGQYVNPVNWPEVTWSAFGRIDPAKPTIVIDGGPGKATGSFIQGNLTDARGLSPVAVIPYATPEGRALLESGNLKEATAKLPDPRLFSDPNYRPVLRQVTSGAPMINGEYTGPYAYLSQVSLADPVQRRDLIQRLEKALNIGAGEPRIHSEFLERLGFDPTMPLALAGMTGNTGPELVAALAASHYLGIYAVTTVGANLKRLSSELDRCHQLTQEKLREMGNPDWEKGAPFGANVIHMNGPYDKQLQEIIKAKERGVPIALVSIAFSEISLALWNEHYMPLLKAGIAVMPLGENERRWKHFMENIYPEVPEEYRHLLAIAPEGAEGGGHNIWKEAPNIRYGHDLTRSLMAQGGAFKTEGATVPHFMTGGQSTPEAIADALLVMANGDARGGMQVGGIMQLAKESTPPMQVKEYIAEAAAGRVGFNQIQSEFERWINVLDSTFSRNLLKLTDILEGCETWDIEIPIGGDKTKKGKDGAPVGRERAERVADILLEEPDAQRTLLHGFWQKGMSDFNRVEFQPLVDRVWPHWLSGDREALVQALSEFSAPRLFQLFKTYRTWAVMDPNVDPKTAYVLGGRSIRAMGQSLEREGENPRKYLGMSAPDIFRDLRDRALRYLTELYQRAMALEQAEQDRFEASTPETFKAVSGVTSVEEQGLGDGETNLVVGIGKDLNQADFLKAVQTAGHGDLARALRAADVGLGEKEGNPLQRTFAVERGDRVEILRRTEAGKTLLENVRVFNKSGRLVAEVRPSGDRRSIQETWYLAQPGAEASPVTWTYEVREGLAGSRRIVAVPGETAAQGREAYIRLWVGADARPNENLSDTAVTTWNVTEDDVLAWHRQVGATSRRYANPRAKGFQVHATYPLRAAWPSMMRAGMHPDANIDFLKVVHSGQTMRIGAPVRVGDTLTASSALGSVKDLTYGREATIVTSVVNQDGEAVATYETKFLSRASRGAETTLFAQDVANPLAATASRLEVDPIEVYRREGLTLSRSDITGYAIDAQWLHTDDRFARRVGFKDGIIAQGWRLMHAVSHSVIEGYLGNDASRFIGFGEGTAVTAPVRPNEPLTLEVDRVGLQGDREVLAFRLISQADGKTKASGTMELRTPPYAAVFPGNASQKVGMAKALYEAGGVGRETLVEACAALGEGGDLLLDVITGGASLPEGNVERRAAFDKAVEEKWLDDVVNSSPAVLATSIAMYRARVAAGFPAPSVVSGHSLGQYVAAVAAGALEVRDLMGGVRLRGEFMRKHARGCIASVVAGGLIDPEGLQKRLNGIAQEGEVLEVANINTLTEKSSQVVISGHQAAVERAVAALKEDGYRASILPGNVAFHSSLLRAMEPEFRPVMDAVPIADPAIPIASIVQPGRLLRTAEEVREELVVLNHERVAWDPNVRGMQAGGAKAFVEFAPGTVLTGMVSRILPDTVAQSISMVTHADEALYGPRPALAPVEEAPKPAPSAKPAPAAVPAAAPAPRAAAPALEPAPASYASHQMQVLDLRLTTARVEMEKGSVKTAALSPLAPSLTSSPSEFLWANVVLSLAETNEGVKPAEVTPETKLAALDMDSLAIAGLFGLVRHRAGIAKMPADQEVKKLETGTVADLFNLVVNYWDHEGERPSLANRGAAIGTPGQSYKQMLQAAGIGGRSAFDLMKDGKLKADTPGVDRVTETVLSGTDEGALAGLDGLIARVEGWQYSKEFAKEGAALRTVKTSFYKAARPRFEAMKQDREARSRAAQAAAPMMMPGVAAAPVSLESAPAAYASHQMQVVDLRLTTARVEMEKGSVKSAALSPLAPSLTSSPSEFLWANVVLSLSETNEGVKPAEVLPETKLAQLDMDSLAIAGLFGLVRHRAGIAKMPADQEVKKLETGTVADLFNLVVNYWDHEGERPSLANRGAAIGTPGQSYKQILQAAGIAGRSAFDLMKDGKLKADTPGVDRVTETVLSGTDEGALAGLDGLIARVEGWQYSKEFAKEGAALRAVKGAFYQRTRVRFEAMRDEREARNRATQASAVVPGMAMPMTGGLAPVAAAVDPDLVRALAREEAFHLIREMNGDAAAGAVDRRLLEFDARSGRVRPVGATVAMQNELQLERLRQETSLEFVAMMTQTWPARLHHPWGEVEMNGAPANLVRLYGDVAEGTLRSGTPEHDYRVRLLANQVDALRVRQARRLAANARSRGLTDVADTLERVASEGEESLRVGGLPQPVWWNSTRMVPDADGKIREVPRGATPGEILDQWERDGLVDARTVADLRALAKGEVSFKGKRILVYGGTGTISQPTVEFFLQLGADVWITTRQDLGRVEDRARDMRNRSAVRGASLRVSTQFVPNFANMEALRQQQEEQGWKPDVIINGMAAEDYGLLDMKLDFHTVTQTLVESYRYAVGQYVKWYKQDPESSPVLSVGNQASPNDKFALGGSGSYSIAKSSMPAGQWAQRRDSENYFHKDGRPVYREVSVLTGAVVPPSDKGIMGGFRTFGDRLEQAARAEGRPLWIFNGADMGAVNVAAFNPVHGHADQIDREADGGFTRLGERPGGLQGLLAQVQKESKTDVARTGEVRSSEVTASEGPAWHPYHDGQIRTVTDYGFFIDETDGANGVANPYNEIRDDDLVVVGLGMVSTWGGSAIDSFTNMLQIRGDYVGPWGKDIGLKGAAFSVGLDIAGMSPADAATAYGPTHLFPNMGPRVLERSGQRADAYHRLQSFVGDDRLVVGTVAEVEALNSDELQEQIARLGNTGYRFEAETIRDDQGRPQEVVVARKQGANLKREVIEKLGPQVMADTPPFDYNRLGGNRDLIDHGARHILNAQIVHTESARGMGLVPGELEGRHGRENVYVIDSFGMGGLEVQRDQEQAFILGDEPKKLDVVVGIPVASAGSSASSQYGAMGEATEDPYACATPKKTIRSAQKQMRDAFRKAEEIDRLAGEASGAAQQVLRLEAERLRQNALKTAIVATSGDDAATNETLKMFHRVGAMGTQAEAEEREFSIDRQQRPHDKGRNPKFQAGTGTGGFKIVTGWAMRHYGYRPLGVLRGADTGTDGPSKEPDGKLRASTGLGRYGQRKVFFNGLRESRMHGIPLNRIRQMNSHSTGTGGDGTQSESFVIGAVMEALEWAALNVATAPGSHPRFADLLRERGVDPRQHRGTQGGDSLIRAIGLDLDHPQNLMQQLIDWPSELLSELGLDAEIFESHAKYNFRHTLGGTFVEDVSLMMQANERLTLPHPGLNNIEDATGRTPIATTLPAATDISSVQPARANYRTPPDQAPAPYGTAGNSFGFNGLDGFVVNEVPQGQRFRTRDEAIQWYTKAIQSEARSIALHRATGEGRIPAIQYYESERVDHTVYEDTREGYEQAEALARRIVAREPDVRLPWQRPPAWLVAQRAAAGGRR
ncbi:MAG TPA: acyltransferase domain-containing protein [bacterium]|nr:acyltransferase domain-containing protein [bacterium]